MEHGTVPSSGLIADQLALRLAATFYAPTQEIRRMKPEHAAFISRLVTARCGLDGLAGGEALAAVAYHVAEWGMPYDMLTDWAVRNGVARPVREGIGRADRVAREHAAAMIAPIPSRLPQNQRMLQAVDRMARTAHAGQRRESGGSYYTHPRRVGAMALDVLRTLRTRGAAIDSPLVDAAIAVALAHDAGEDGPYSAEPYDPRRPYAKFTPLSIRYVLEQTGSPYGAIAANSLRLLLRPEQLGTPSYLWYIKRGLGELLFVLIKFNDIYDNLVTDPKPLAQSDPAGRNKIRRKWRQYRRGMQKIRAAASLHPQAPWLPQYYDAVESVPSARSSDMLLALDEYMGLSSNRP